MNTDYKKIKKYYGENMYHLCRELFPTILENEGALFELLEKNFSYNKFLCEDLVNLNLVNEFKNFIYRQFDSVEIEEEIVTKTPTELLSEAGYDLYECKTEEDIQMFKKYYEPNEELCTFRGGRLNSCYVFFAIKKNVNDINRKDFTDPKRQDEYGTSVISIQFSKGCNNIVSIKNRYNHKVSNPDATFSNNLDNIIPGLTKSFENYYDYNLKLNNKSFSFPVGYVLAEDGRFYKYNYEINGVYYCINNIIIDGHRVIKTYSETEKYLLMDYFIIDLVNKKVSTYELIGDCFDDYFYGLKKIEVLKDKKHNEKDVIFYFEDEKYIRITLNKYNKMIKYFDNNTRKVFSDFLYKVEDLRELVMTELKEASFNFLNNATDIEVLKLDLLEKAGNSFLYENIALKELNLPKLRIVGNDFMSYNYRINKVNMPSLIKVGNNFLVGNTSLNSVDFNNLREIGSNFLANNVELSNISLPNVEEIDYSFLVRNKGLTCISFPKLRVVSDMFLYENIEINKAYLPRLEQTGSSFLYNNLGLKELYLPYLKEVSDSFLFWNKKLDKLFVPELYHTGREFLYYNIKLKELNVPHLYSMMDDALTNNYDLEVFNAPCLNKIFDFFLYSNRKLKILNIPNVEYIGSHVLSQNNSLRFLLLPKVKTILHDFLEQNYVIEKIYAPYLKHTSFNNERVSESITNDNELVLGRCL